jgi:segregation and condensation protein B
MNDQNIKQIVEAVLLAAGKPLSLDNILAVFGEDEKPERDEIRQVIAALQEDYSQRGIELVQVASGYRVQVIQEMEPWVSRLTEEKPARYSRALLETLALVAYRQPITRGEIEDIRGVSVSSSIMKTLQDREWVRIVGHRDVPGRPAMYGTTKQFLDYFNLKGLDDLPTLMELRDIDTINAELDFDLEGESAESPASAPHTEADETGEVSEPEQSVVVAKVGVDASGNSETIH